MTETEKVERNYNFKILKKSKDPPEPKEDPEFSVIEFSWEFCQKAFYVLLLIVIWNDCEPDSGAPFFLVWARNIMVAVWDFLYYIIFDNEEIQLVCIWGVEIAFFLWVWRTRMVDVKDRMVKKVPGPLYGSCHWIPLKLCSLLTFVDVDYQPDDPYSYKEDTCATCCTKLMCIDIDQVRKKKNEFKHEALAEAYYPEDYPHINKQLRPEEDDWKFENAKKEEFGMTEEKMNEKILERIDPGHKN